jgi:hypothetical protein
MNATRSSLGRPVASLCASLVLFGRGEKSLQGGTVLGGNRIGNHHPHCQESGEKRLERVECHRGRGVERADQQ